MADRLWRVALIGNATALAVLVAVLVAAGPLWEDESPPAPLVQPHSSGEVARRGLLVVLDGLPEEATRDRTLTPFVSGLALTGGRATALVETLVPSTVAGIEALNSGRRPPPLSFLRDFGSGPAESGGLLAAVLESGGRTFVAGPRLWGDLYGTWISRGFFVDSVGSDDDRVLEASVRALEERRYRLVVAHLGALDDASHTAWRDSPSWRGAVRSYDRAVARLVASAGSATAVVVTSDHGTSSTGGHAGPEPSVLRTPVIAVGPGLPAGDLGRLRQSEIGALVARALLPVSHASASDPSPSATVPAAASRPALAWLALAFSLLCLLRILERGRQMKRPRKLAMGLALALWCAVGIAALHSAAAALVVALTGLVLGAARRPPAPTRKLHFAFVLLGSAYAAAALGISLLLLDGPAPGGVRLALSVGFVLAFFSLIAIPAPGGWGPSGNRRLLWTGAALPLAAGSVRFLLGETWSLSTVDVRAAFGLADGPFGLAGALAVVTMQQALPLVILLAAALCLASRSDGGGLGEVLGGAAASLAGTATTASMVLVHAPSQTLASLAVGGLARTLSDVCYLFLAAVPLVALRAAAVPAPIRRRIWSRTAAAALLGALAVTAARADGLGSVRPPFSLDLKDQYGGSVVLPGEEPAGVTLVAVADRSGARGSRAWAERLADRYAPHLSGEKRPALEIVAVAHLTGVPWLARGVVRRRFRSQDSADGGPGLAIALDWKGTVAEQIEFVPGVPNIVVLDSERLVLHAAGDAYSDAGAEVLAALDRLLGLRSPVASRTAR